MYKHIWNLRWDLLHWVIAQKRATFIHSYLLSGSLDFIKNMDFVFKYDDKGTLPIWSLVHLQNLVDFLSLFEYVNNIVISYCIILLYVHIYFFSSLFSVVPQVFVHIDRIHLLFSSEILSIKTVDGIHFSSFIAFNDMIAYCTITLDLAVFQYIKCFGVQ